MTVGASSANLATPALNTFRGTNMDGSLFWARLHIGDPGAAGLTNPSVGAGVTQQALVFGAPVMGRISLTNVPAWVAGLGFASEVITHLSLWDDTNAFRASVLLDPDELDAWVPGDTFQLDDLDLALAPLAS